MKNQFLLLFFILGNISFAQINNNSSYYNPLKEIFNSKNTDETYLKIPPEKIQLFDNKIILDGIEVEFHEILSNEFLQILKEGLLIPDKISGQICCLSELTQINPNSQVKRFSFWSFPKKIENPKDSTSIDYILSTRINPDVYYFELKNEYADENTDLIEFIKGSKLTFFKHGGIII